MTSRQPLGVCEEVGALPGNPPCFFIGRLEVINDFQLHSHALFVQPSRLGLNMKVCKHILIVKMTFLLLASMDYLTGHLSPPAYSGCNFTAN
jgi:hypothetical protein